MEDEDPAEAKSRKFMCSLRKAAEKEGLHESVVDGWRAVVSIVDVSCPGRGLVSRQSRVSGCRGEESLLCHPPP